MTPGIIEYLSSKYVVDIACGDNHTIAVTSQGEVYAWGMNQNGQLGLKDNETRMKPSQIKEVLSEHKIVSVACGANHSVFLSSRGEVLACGKGKNGQLGIGDSSLMDKKIPILIESLRGIPVVDVVCGSDHTFFLTASGSVLACGNNKFGQLGLNDDVDRIVPTLIPSLKERQIVEISCGWNHSFAVSNSGLVYSFGSNQFHQLPIKTKSIQQPLATIALDLMGSPIIKIAAGARHSIAIRSQEKIDENVEDRVENVEKSLEVSPLLVWGNGMNGELGSGSTKVMEGPEPLDSFVGKKVSQIACGGMHTIVVVNSDVDRNIRRRSLDRIENSLIIGEKIEESKKFPHRRVKFLELEELIGRIFANPSSLNASFLSEDHLSTSEENSGLNLSVAREVYLKLLELSDASVLSALFNATLRLLPNLRLKSHHPAECLRAYLILFENPMLYPTTKHNVVLMEKIVSNVMHLPIEQKRILKNWIRLLSTETFLHTLKIFQSFLSYVTLMDIQSQQVSAVSIISMLYEANEEANLVDYNEFYNHSLSSALKMEEEYAKFKSQATVFSFYRYPFLLDTEAKSKLLHYDAHVTMGKEQAFHFIGQILQGRDSMHFDVRLKVNRKSIVKDAFEQLKKMQRPHDLKRPLRIEFEGEEGIDEGGLTKEFFQLILKELFDEEFGAFIYEEETRNHWFSSDPKASLDQLFLAGIILGLGLYNSVLLEVRFPLIVYKKLLGGKPNLSDLKQAMPAIGLSLQKLLDYKGDVETDLCLNFTVAQKTKEGVKYVELVPGGNDLPVTTSNRHKYVKCMVEHYLESSVKEQFASFEKGFFYVAGDPHIVHLFHPEEMETIICGSSEELNFSELQRVTRYEGFDSESQQIKWFWEVVNELSYEDKKKFLAFSTGSDRVPIGGLKNISFIIQKNGINQEQLPSASTCYNVLLLPEYVSKEILQHKFHYAIENGQGFGLK
eukprot:TRINITY_DN4055_c0_g2_i2.p1 TRINITY_DN4055_c0_g2~~TRINITY_DN4055_c0_g2_i2.p1  ORF type:complete len:958 (+),score=321.19 TRINITY_DN4055_c0_g2_i2:373-3246(+)